MVIFFTVLLGISVIGLAGLLGVRRYELNTGRILFANLRPALGALLDSTLHAVERRAPAAAQHLATQCYRRARESMHRGVAWAVLHAEHLLEQTLTVLRHSTAKEGGGEASAFLREVAEHKKKLQKKSGEKAIYEE